MSCGRYPNEVFAVSDPIAWAAGGDKQVQLPFMEGKWTGMGRPVVPTMKFEFLVDFTTGAGNSLRAAQLAQIVDRIYIKDGDGERLLCSGAELLHFMRYVRQVPFIGRDLAVNTANQVRRYFLEVPIEPWDWSPISVDPGAYRWDAKSLRAGEVQVVFSGATIGQGTNLATVNSCTMRLRLGLLDEGVDKVAQKMRVRYKAFPVSQSRDNYQVRGALLNAHFNIGRVGEALQAEAVHATQQITSDALKYTAIDDFWLNDVDLERRQPRRTAENLTADEKDPVIKGTSQSIYQPRPRTSTTELPLLDLLDVETTVAFNTGTLLATNKPTIEAMWIEDRNPCHRRAGYVNSSKGPKAVTDVPQAYQEKFEVFTSPTSSMVKSPGMK